MPEIGALLMDLGQQVWQQELPRDQGGQVCLVSIAPFLLAATVVGLRSAGRALRARRLGTAGE